MFVSVLYCTTKAESLLPVQKGQPPIFLTCWLHTAGNSVCWTQSPGAMPTPGWVNRHFVSFFALASPFTQLVPGSQVSEASPLTLSLRARTSPSQAQGTSPLGPAARPSLSGFCKAALPASCLRPSLPHHPLLLFTNVCAYLFVCLWAAMQSPHQNVNSFRLTLSCLSCPPSLGYDLTHFRCSVHIHWLDIVEWLFAFVVTFFSVLTWTRLSSFLVLGSLTPRPWWPSRSQIPSVFSSQWSRWAVCHGKVCIGEPRGTFRDTVFSPFLSSLPLSAPFSYRGAKCPYEHCECKTSFRQFKDFHAFLF